MKIRNGFVTNSSSSSFIILGNQVDIDNVDFNYHRYKVMGRYLYEGQDIFDLDVDILKVIRANFESREFNYPIIQVAAEFQEYQLIKELNVKNVRVYTGEVAYSSTDSVENFIERYV